MKRKTSEAVGATPPPQKTTAAPHIASFSDLKPECLGRIFHYVDLKTRVRAMRVSRAVYDAIDYYGPLLDTLSLKHVSTLHGDLKDDRFLVNNEVAVAESDLPDVIAWVARRFNGQHFELVMPEHRLGTRFAYKLFEQLHGLKSVRIIFVRALCEWRLTPSAHCDGLWRLLRQSTDTLENLALCMDISKSVVGLLAQCRQLKSVAFEDGCSFSGKAPLTWPDLPLLKHVHLGRSYGPNWPRTGREDDALGGALEKSLRAAAKLQSIELDTFERCRLADLASSMLITPPIDFDALRTLLDKRPQLKTVVGMGAFASSALPPSLRRLGFVLDLIMRRVGKPDRQLLVVSNTLETVSAACELRSLLPAIRWQGALPTRAADRQRMNDLQAFAAARGVADLWVRQVGARQAARLAQLPAALRSRRQFELSTASLTLRLVLLPDYTAAAAAADDDDDDDDDDDAGTVN